MSSGPSNPALAAVEGLPADDTHASDYNAPRSFRPRAADVVDSVHELMADLSNEVLEGRDGPAPGLSAAVDKLEEALGPLMSALQAVRQTELQTPDHAPATDATTGPE